jgi:hypothetical protein
MTIRSFSGVMGAVLLVFSVVACGGDDDDDGSGATGSAALSSCNAFCDAAGTASCPDYTDAAECKSFECDGLDQTPAGACADAIKAYYDCLKAQPDVCMTGCSTEADAYLTACT